MTIDISKIETRLFINNQWFNSSSGKTFNTVNPATEEVICAVQEADEADVDKAVAAAKAAFSIGSEWRSMDGSKRRDLLLKLAELIERDMEYLEELESLDNGKPLGRNGAYGSKFDMMGSAAGFRYYAGWADKLQGKVIPVDGNNLCYTRREPVGVCGCIIPWNGSISMATIKLAPALACGCTVVLKTSEKTPLSGLHLAKLIQEAGFPAGVVNIISGFGPTAGAAMARHPDIDKIAFTGSTLTGKKIMQSAGETNLKRFSLELGGKSPLIVFDDADIGKALFCSHMGVFLNQGQVCSSSSRIFVQDTIYDKFVEEAVKMAKSIKIGPFTDPEATHGPLVDDIQFKRVVGYLEKGKAEGAYVAAGGKRHGNKGFFVEPTVFTNVTDSMTIAKEEIFGPVMSILKFSTDEEVVERANATMYGLAAGIFSNNAGRALGIANQLQAGTVWVNQYMTFDPAAPFGGYKQSGIGREHGEEGLNSWLETKCIMLPLDGPKV